LLQNERKLGSGGDLTVTAVKRTGKRIPQDAPQPEK